MVEENRTLGRGRSSASRTQTALLRGLELRLPYGSGRLESGQHVPVRVGEPEFPTTDLITADPLQQVQIGRLLSHDRLLACHPRRGEIRAKDRKSTRLNSSHVKNSYAVFCLKKKTPGTAGNYESG